MSDQDKKDDLPTPSEAEDEECIDCSTTCTDEEFQDAVGDFMEIFSKAFPALYRRLYPEAAPEHMEPHRCCSVLAMAVLNYLKFQTNDLSQEETDEAIKLFTTTWMQMLSQMPGQGVHGMTILKGDIEEHPELNEKIAELQEIVDANKPDKTIH